MCRWFRFLVCVCLLNFGSQHYAHGPPGDNVKLTASETIVKAAYELNASRRIELQVSWDVGARHS